MSLKQTVAPTTEPITAAEAKLHLRVDIGDDDALIDTLIVAARDQAEVFTGRQLITATWVYKIDRFPNPNMRPRGGSWVSEIRLPRPPLITVGSITYLDGDAALQTLSTDVYAVDVATEPGRVTLKWNQSWPATQDIQDAVTVTFNAGYGTATAVPSDIKAAIKMLVGNLYENREATTDISLAAVPMAVESLLWGRRILEVA